MSGFIAVSASLTKTEGVDEVELEAVDVPVLERLDIGVDEEFPDLREARVENRSAHAAVVSFDILALELLVVGALEPYEGNGVPHHVLDSEVLHPLHVRGHVGEAALRDLPVAAERVAAVRVVRLPAVVDDESLHAEFRRDRKLRFDVCGEDVLVEIVPARVERVAGGNWNAARHDVRRLLDPRYGFAHRVGKALRASIEPHTRLVVRNRGLGRLEPANADLENTPFLADTAYVVEVTHTLLGRDGKMARVVSIEVDEDRHALRDLGVRTRAPVRAHAAVACVDVPGIVHADLRNQRRQTRLRRELRLRAVERDLRDLRTVRRDFARKRKLPAVAILAVDLDLSKRKRSRSSSGKNHRCHVYFSFLSLSVVLKKSVTGPRSPAS